MAKTEKFAEHTLLRLPDVNIYNNPGFRYTTPSASKEKLSAQDKRDLGCNEKPTVRHCFKGESGKAKCFSLQMAAEEAAEGKKLFTKIEKSFTGGRCPPGKGHTCSRDSEVYDERCKGQSKPCGSSRSTCPVQLVWVKGKPNLRFCMKKSQPGYLVPVKDVREAMKISDEACRQWPYQLGVQEKAEGSEEEGWDPEFFSKNAPQIPRRAREAYPGSGGLGRVRNGGLGPVKGGAGGMWLGIGLAMGLTAAVLLKGRQAPAK